MTARDFWTTLRDNRLLTAWGRGHGAVAIAKKLGTTATAVTARMARLRELAGRAGAEPWQRASVRRALAARRRTAGELDEQRAALAAMDQAITGGTPRGKAISQAYRAGVTWRLIGEHLGVTAAAAHQAGRAWARRTERALANRERAQARAELERKLIREMAGAVRRGMPQGQAMARAHRAGASWVQIAEHFGIAQQTAHYQAKIWTQRGRPVRPYRSRTG
jgi:hypothetical protein